MEPELENILNAVKEAFTEHMPFNRHIGIKVDSLKENSARLSFDMKDELVGNYITGVLHGGVISTVLDAVGAITGIARFAINAFKKSNGFEENPLSALSGSGTIDMRVDYLRPGRGKHFIASSTTLRAGSKLTVTRMELRNDKDELIAVGTGAYIIGK